MYNGKPVIGLTGSYSTQNNAQLHTIGQSYMNTVRNFGGIPLIIPVLADPEEQAYLVSQCDGLILTGGDDIDPKYYHQTILNDTVALCPERDTAEWQVLDLAVARNIPILGICRGVQVLNVYFGGTLLQDIPSQQPSDVAHRMEKPYHRTCHSCDVTPGTKFRDVVGEDMVRVNSHHHQAVDAAAPGFTVLARSEDGIVEAVGDESKPFCMGVQWHPERIWDLEESSANLFRGFLAACKG